MGENDDEKLEQLLAIYKEERKDEDIKEDEEIDEEKEIISILIGEDKNNQNNKTLEEKIYKGTGTISWPSILFGCFYWIYRKIYIPAIIVTIIELLISVAVGTGFFGTKIGSIAMIIITIANGFLFYPLYKSHIYKKIKEYSEKGYSFEEKKIKATQEGGTLPMEKSILFGVIYYFAYFAIYIISILIIYFLVYIFI